MIVDHRLISERFRRHDSVIVIVETVRQLPTLPDLYWAMEDVSNAVMNLPFVRSVDSISSLDILGSAEYRNGPVGPTIEQLTEHDGVSGLLLSEDELYASARVGVELPDSNAATVSSAMQQLRDTVGGSMPDDRYRAHYTGTMALNEAYIDVVRHDLKVILPALLLVTCVILVWLFGSLKVLAATVPVAIFSTLFAFGVGGFAGTDLAAINAFVPVIVLSFSIATCTHILVSYARYRNTDEPRRAAALAVRANHLPMLASVTTVFGFSDSCLARRHRSKW